MSKVRKGIIQVYTDGSYDWNRKVGGYGAVIFMVINGTNHMRKFSSTCSYVDTTHNRMEMRAILAALKRIEPGYNIDIYTDSKYCVTMFNNIQSTRYRIKWAANPNLWKLIKDQWVRHISKGSYINISWVRGHSGNTFNEMADKLAREGNMKKKKVVCK